jgi:pimeloyl-ACP methyl ester carboxylesterase
MFSYFSARTSKYGFIKTRAPFSCNIDYYITGKKEGDPILLIMGWMCSYSVWPDHFLIDLIEKGYRIILFNNRGIGHSPQCSPLDYTFELLSNDIDDLLLELISQKEIKTKKPIVIGWSMGAMIAIYYSITRNIPTCVSICGGLNVIGNITIDIYDPDDIIAKFFLSDDSLLPKQSCLYLIAKSVTLQESNPLCLPLQQIGKWQTYAMYKYKQFIDSLDFSSIELPYLDFIYGEYDIVVPPISNVDFLKSNWDRNKLKLTSQSEGHGLIFIPFCSIH